MTPVFDRIRITKPSTPAKRITRKAGAAKPRRLTEQTGNTPARSAGGTTHTKEKHA